MRETSIKLIAEVAAKEWQTFHVSFGLHNFSCTCTMFHLACIELHVFVQYYNMLEQRFMYLYSVSIGLDNVSCICRIFHLACIMFHILA